MPSTQSELTSWTLTAELPYRPPHPDVGSPGRAWDYQVSSDLIDTLRTQVQCHFTNYTSQHIEKTTIPLYLSLSGAGTGKSKNAAELHQTAYKCFNGHYFQRNEKNAQSDLGFLRLSCKLRERNKYSTQRKRPAVSLRWGWDPFLRRYPFQVSPANSISIDTLFCQTKHWKSLFLGCWWFEQRPRHLWWNDTDANTHCTWRSCPDWVQGKFGSGAVTCPWTFQTTASTKFSKNWHLLCDRSSWWSR